MFSVVVSTDPWSVFYVRPQSPENTQRLLRSEMLTRGHKIPILDLLLWTRTSQHSKPNGQTVWMNFILGWEWAAKIFSKPWHCKALDAGMDFIVDQLQGTDKVSSGCTECKQQGICIRKGDVTVISSLLWFLVRPDISEGGLSLLRDLTLRGTYSTSCINGFIDGFSRAIICLHAASSLITTCKSSGDPRLMWTDTSAESAVVRDIYGETASMTEQRRGVTSQGRAPQTSKLKADGEWRDVKRRTGSLDHASSRTKWWGSFL